MEEKFSAQKPLLGEILLARKLITQEQRDEALRIQKRENLFFGEALVKLGYMEERDIVVAVVLQCNIPYIAIDKYDIDKSIIQLITPELALKEMLVPLDRVGDVLSVVMLNPMDTGVKAELKRMTNCRVAPFIATRTQIKKAIDRWYKGGVSSADV